MQAKDYYDEFAATYEKHRGRGYHRLIDDLEVDLVARYAQGKSVLEAGCGTGLILSRVAEIASEAWGLDISSGMLGKARARGLRVVQGSLTDLPFPDERFDVVYSFKVLAHVERIREALAELARVTRPGGHLVLEFYNPLSLRTMIKRLKPATRISERTTDEAVYTRYDALKQVREYLPPGVRVVHVRGVRIVTLVSHLVGHPFLERLFSRIERALADAPLFRLLGGFLIVVARKEG
ncbi:MAG: class I SAM-dependent methyltransferase [Deltaproteobacteria bacterium]|nr:class I SAM-dependent methyltransferase [Deltaproteobacteria bacterium]